MIRGGGRTGLSWNVMMSWYLWNFQTWFDIDFTSKNVLLEGKKRKIKSGWKWFWVLCQRWYDGIITRYISITPANVSLSQKQEAELKSQFVPGQSTVIISLFEIPYDCKCLSCTTPRFYNSPLRWASTFILVFPLGNEWRHNWTLFGFFALVPIRCLSLQMSTMWKIWHFPCFLETSLFPSPPYILRKCPSGKAKAQQSSQAVNNAHPPQVYALQCVTHLKTAMRRFTKRMFATKR